MEYPDKPLYIESSSARVDLDEAALVVRQSNTADRYYPLRRLTRIIARNTVDFTSKALIACAEQQVPVVFVNRKHAVVARVVGEQGITEMFHHVMFDLSANPVRLGQYLQWKASRQLELGVDESNNFSRSKLLDSVCLSWMLIKLHPYGLDISDTGWNPEFPTPVRDCAGILAGVFSYLAIGRTEEELIDALEQHRIEIDAVAKELELSLVNLLRRLE